LEKYLNRSVHMPSGLDAATGGGFIVRSFVVVRNVFGLGIN